MKEGDEKQVGKGECGGYLKEEDERKEGKGEKER